VNVSRKDDAEKIAYEKDAEQCVEASLVAV